MRGPAFWKVQGQNGNSTRNKELIGPSFGPQLRDDFLWFTTMVSLQILYHIDTDFFDIRSKHRYGCLPDRPFRLHTAFPRFAVSVTRGMDEGDQEMVFPSMSLSFITGGKVHLFDVVAVVCVPHARLDVPISRHSKVTTRLIWCESATSTVELYCPVVPLRSTAISSPQVPGWQV